MTETGNTNPDAPDEQPASNDSTAPAAPSASTVSASSTDPADAGSGRFEFHEPLYKVGLGLFVLLAVVAVVQLYASVGATIDTFISQRYRPLFRAAFNLAVLLAAGIGISWCVRELNGE